MAGAVTRRGTTNKNDTTATASTTITPPKKRGRPKAIENGNLSTATAPDAVAVADSAPAEPEPAPVKTKRAIPEADHAEPEPAPVKKAKRAKLDKTLTLLSAPEPGSEVQRPGTIYAFGLNDVGQLGFECIQRKYPALVPAVQDMKFKAVAAGGMHTVALTKDGEVWTWGLNDDRALGRPTQDEDDNFKPGKVNLPVSAVQVSAGDSHCAALGKDGNVYIWGVYNDANGKFGLLPGCGDEPEMKVVSEPSILPVILPQNTSIVRIRSGGNHIVILCSNGEVMTAGSDFQSLGRNYRNLRNHGTERDDSLTPKVVQFGRRVKVVEIYTGQISTICKTATGEFWVFGLNNTKMLGIEHDENDGPMIEKPVRSSFITEHKFKQIAMGNYHSLGLTEDGKVYSWGKFTDGQLGLGDLKNDICVPQHIPTIKEPVRSISAGGSVSYAITNKGQVYAWGFGSNWQLGNGEEDEQMEPAYRVFIDHAKKKAARRSQ